MILGHLFELAGCSGFSTFAGHFQQSRQSNVVQRVEQGVEGASEVCANAGFSPYQGRQEIAENAGEIMHLDLLVGPVKSGSNGEVVRVFDVLESLFYG